MISELQAVVMLENELLPEELKLIHKRHLDAYVQSYARRMCEVGTTGDIKKFETHLMIANRLYSEGCKEVKEAMEEIYMSSLSHVLELNKELLELAKKNLPCNLMNLMHQYHLAGNP